MLVAIRQSLNLHHVMNLGPFLQNGFCTAGLYDSVPLPALAERTVDYASESLLWDEALRNEVRS